MNQWPEFLALTGTERRVAFFLVGAFIVGTGIRLLQETFPSERKVDYRLSDSTFAALSVAPVRKEPGARAQNQQDPVDLNTATKEQLVALPGIGAVTAERILLRRRELGRFTTVEDLKSVKGISAHKLEKLKPLITVHPVNGVH
jgi:competence ComEA-like helix-hairpin-helix protein